jgi:hypothetical protein
MSNRNVVLIVRFGRCLRPALYSSLRSSPSHPMGVSALRVTIAIACARFARKQWELRKSTARSRRLIRNESATSRRVRAGTVEGSTAMTRTAFCRKSPRVPRGCWLRSWALGISDREATKDKRGWRDKSADVCRAHVVGWFAIFVRGGHGADVAGRQDVNKINAPSASMRRGIVPALA